MAFFLYIGLAFIFSHIFVCTPYLIWSIKKSPEDRDEASIIWLVVGSVSILCMVLAFLLGFTELLVIK